MLPGRSTICRVSGPTPATRLERSPYVALAVTLALLALLPLNSSIVASAHPRRWLAPVALIFIALSVLHALVIVPNFLLPRMRARRSRSQVSAVRWLADSANGTLGHGVSLS